MPSAISKASKRAVPDPPWLGREAPMTLGRLQEGAEAAHPLPRPGGSTMIAILREEIRRIVLDELRYALRKRMVGNRHGGSPVPSSSSTSCNRRPSATWRAACAEGLPRTNMAAQIIEVAPGLDIEPLTDVALKHADVGGGMLVVVVRLSQIPAARPR